MTAAVLREVQSHERAMPRPAAKRRGLGSWLLFVVIVIIAFYGLIFSRISLDRSAFEIDELQEQIAAEETRFFELRATVAEMRSPDRISNEAASLGLVYPDARTELVARMLPQPDLDPEMRWAQLRTLLSAQP